MPMLIEHVDAIARKKQRTVLYVTFTPQNYDRYSGPRNPDSSLSYALS